MKQLNKATLHACEAFSDYSHKAESDGKFYLLKFASVENAEVAEGIVSKLREKLSSEFEIYREGEKVVVAREFIEGTLPEPKIDSPKEALEQIIEIAEALGGRLHGNLKPENILRNEDGNWIIVDFGIRAFHELVRKNSGTGLQYLAPEQICGEYTERSDVYALGMFLGKQLCGKTPFDGMPENLLLQEKQQGTPDWSIIADIRDELKKLVEKATENDANSRHQSITEFLEACRRTEKLLSGGNADVPQHTPSPLPGEDEDNVPLNPNKRFVLVGHTGAGKTVLAAGLYATFSRNKNLSVEAADEPTKQLANNFKSILETGTWPAATTGAAQKLCFRIAHNCDAAELDFDEYMGERVSDVESYIRDILKEPNGVLLLMNPGGLQFRLKAGADDTPQKLAIRRNKLLSDLKSIIDYLFKLKTRPAVALVITASDRLKTDLKDFAPEFNRYVEEIETALDTRDKNWWKRFEVSVCGELADQTHPKLNPQGIDEPFLWLTERYNAVVRKKRITKFLAQTACGLSALALSAAVWWGVDWYRASVPEREMRACIAEFSGKNKIGELSACAQKLVAIRRSYCTENHITENHGKRVAACVKTCSPFFLYPDRKQEFEKNIKNLELAIDATRANYYEAKVNLALEKATEENCKVTEDVAGWIPLQASEIGKRFDALKTVCKNEIPVARERYVYNEILGKLNKIIEKPENGLMHELVEKVEVFQSTDSVLTQEEHKSHLDNLAKALSGARDSVFEYNAQRLYSELNGLHLKRIDELVPFVKRWNVFKAQKNVGVRKDLVDSYLPKISGMMRGKVLGLLERLLDAHTRVQMESEKQFEAKFIDEWNEKIVPIADDFNEECRNLAEKTLEQLAKDWRTKMKQQIDDFIASVKGLSATEQLQRLKQYYAERDFDPQNPYVENAEIAIFDYVDDSIDEIFKEWKHSKDEYIRLKDLCVAIRATPSRFIQEKKVYQFANKYVSWLDGYHRTVTIRINQLRTVKVGAIYIDSIYFKGRSVSLGYNGSYPKEISFSLDKPWEVVDFTWHVKDRGAFYDGGFGGVEASNVFSIPWFGRQKQGEVRCVWDESAEVTGWDFQSTVTGKTIVDIVNEVWPSGENGK
ncbi:MAG: protein kinase [Opitutales bacterium]|nr:protein kinase [Opitutales bacterium]